MLLLARPGPARAQRPAERASLDSLQASFTPLSDTLALARRERDGIAVARVNRDSAMLHMELGFVAYRLGELTGAHQRWDDAASEFQWAADLHPDWPYAWYWLGMSEMALGEVRAIALENLRQIIGIDYLSNAARAFEHAVAADPSFSRGIDDLAQTVLRQRIAARLDVVQGMLRRLAAGPAGAQPAVQLWRGRIERRQDVPDSSLEAFKMYLALTGDTAMGALEIARDFAILSRTDSCSTWYVRAVSRPVSDSLRRELRHDVIWIATPQELAEFDAAAPDSLGPWLRRFWARRDAADARRPGERLAEQFRRYHYVVEHFGLLSRHRKQDVAFAYYDTTQTDFDDRGIIYLRHGEPAERASFSEPGVEANESWLYKMAPPDGDLVLHFVAVNNVSDFRLMQSLRDVCRPRIANITPLINGSLAVPGRNLGPAVGADVGAVDFARCVQSRARLSDLYDRLSRVGSTTTDNTEWAGERRAAMAMTHEAVTTDTYVQHFPASLRPVVSWFVFADSAMRPELHLVFAVPADRLRPVAGADGSTTYPLSLRLLVTDSATGRMVAALDTVRVFHSAQRITAGSLTQQAVLDVPPGPRRFHFLIEEGRDGPGDVRKSPVDVYDFGDAFSASDVVLGREGSGLVWHRDGESVPLNPLMWFPKDGDATLYYEVYGLPAGASIETRVLVRPEGGRSFFQRLFGKNRGADLSYTTVTDRKERATVRQTIALAGLSPGRYRLEVDLVDSASGARVVRSTPFDIGSGSAP